MLHSSHQIQLARSRSWLLAGLACLLLVACSGETIPRDDLFVVGGSPRLVVQTENGSISVGTTTASVIQVTATIRNPGRVDYRAFQIGDTVGIIAEVKGGFNFFRKNGGADIQVLVPQDTGMVLESKNGEITVEGVLTSKATLTTSNAAINLTQVHLTGIQGIIDLETSNGPVTLDDVSGNLFLKTANGSVDIRNFVGQVQAQTSNGNLHFAGRLLAGSNNSLRASNGKVEVTLADTPGVDVDASVSNGRIHSELPFAAIEEDKDNRLVGTIGTGGSSLEIKTSNGSITIQ